MATNSNNSNSNNINSGKLLNPPVLINVDNIDSWLHDLEIWRCVTGLDKKQQGPIIYLSLPEKIKQSCRDLKIPALNNDNGLDLLVDKLEKLYVKDSKTTTYLAYEKFESFQRPVNMTIQDYLNEFERLYNDIMRFKIELPSAVLAYRLLKSANLSEEKQQLARATIADLLSGKFQCPQNWKMELKIPGVFPIFNGDGDFNYQSGLLLYYAFEFILKKINAFNQFKNIKFTAGKEYHYRSTTFRWTNELSRIYTEIVKEDPRDDYAMTGTSSAFFAQMISSTRYFLLIFCIYLVHKKIRLMEYRSC